MHSHPPSQSDSENEAVITAASTFTAKVHKRFALLDAALAEVSRQVCLAELSITGGGDSRTIGECMILPLTLLRNYHLIVVPFGMQATSRCPRIYSTTVEPFSFGVFLEKRSYPPSS